MCISKKISLKGSANDIYKRIEKNALDIIKKRLLKPKLSYKKQMGKPTFFKRRNEKMSKISNSVNNINKLYDFLRMLDAEDYPKAYLELKNLKVEFFNIKNKIKFMEISGLKKIKKILIISAHPDDEVLGCGGLIARIKKTNKIQIVFLTDGVSSRKKDKKKY